MTERCRQARPHQMICLVVCGWPAEPEVVSTQDSCWNSDCHCIQEETVRDVCVASKSAWQIINNKMGLMGNTLLTSAADRFCWCSCRMKACLIV
jgi:hypothetical protein